jgi:hypothetical protein
MPTIGPDMRPCYYPHEVYDIVGKAMSGEIWTSPILPLRNSSIKEVERAGISVVLADEQLDQPRDEDAPDANYTIDNIFQLFFNTGFVPVWFFSKDEEWIVLGRDSWSDTPWFFDSWASMPEMEKIFVIEIWKGQKGTGGTGRLLVDKAPMDRAVVGYHKSSRGKQGPPEKGSGGNEAHHEVQSLLKLIIEIYGLSEPPKSHSKAADMIISALSAQGLACPSSSYLRNLIKFMHELRYLT